MAIILTGRVPSDYLITGFVVSLIVASIVVYILSQARGIEVRAKAMLEEAYQSLEEKVDARTSDLVSSNERLRLEASERKKAQGAIKDSEKRYRDLFNGISDLIMIHDQNGRMIDVNSAAAELSGYTRTEMIGRPLSDFIAPKFRSLFQSEYLKYIKEEKQLQGVAVFQGKDGTEYHIEFRNTLIEQDGSEPYISGVGRDITEQLQAKKKLEKTKQEAEAANLAKSEFLANMSHELRTPLNHIIGFTELVVDKNFGDLNETQEEYLTDVLQSSGHLLSLINDILDLSKVEAGKQELEISDVHIRELLENSLLMVKEKSLKHGIALKHNLDGIPSTVQADGRKLKQVVYNLLSNAAKFTPDGGEIELNGRRVNGAKGGSEGEYLEVSVRDTGIGLNKVDLDRIFNPFEQVESSKSKRFQGTGLGLALTKSFVELHGGKIWAESEGEGRGSTFRFIVPI